MSLKRSITPPVSNWSGNTVTPLPPTCKRVPVPSVLPPSFRAGHVPLDETQKGSSRSSGHDTIVCPRVFCVVVVLRRRTAQREHLRTRHF